MKAYSITWPRHDKKLRSIIADLGYQRYLPKVICLTCEPQFKRWGSLFELPAFNFDFLSEKDLNIKSVVSLSEFQRIHRQIINAVGYPIPVRPGTAFGLLSGTVSTRKLEDFLWGRISVPQIDKRANELLAAEGVQLMTAELDMRFHGRKVDTHLAIQVEPAPLLTQDNLKYFSISRCPVCGHYKRYAIGNKPYMTSGLEIIRSAWPEGKNLVRAIEGAGIIASQRFIDAVQKHKLTGISFVECGKYV